jgi:hypothetical protein
MQEAQNPGNQWGCPTRGRGGADVGATGQQVKRHTAAYYAQKHNSVGNGSFLLPLITHLFPLYFKHITMQMMRTCIFCVITVSWLYSSSCTAAAAPAAAGAQGSEGAYVRGWVLNGV